MEDAHVEVQDEEPAGGLGRRQFMVRAAVAGTVAFAVPTIVTMAPAGAAELTSPPPRPPTPPEVEVETKTVNLPLADPDIEVAAAGTPAAKPDVEVRGALATTGLPIDQVVGAGVAAVAGGGALHVWSTRAGSRSTVAADGADPTDPPDTLASSGS